MKTVDVKIWFAILCMGAGWSPLARSEDLTTLTGQTYSNIVVQRFDRQGIFISHAGGSAQVLYKEILPELRGYYKTRARYPISLETMSGQKEDPAGPNDLATLSGQIYRNVVVKQVSEDFIRIAHDSGMETVYFSAIPRALQEKYRTGVPVVPDPAPGANDLVAVSGQIFRNIEIRRIEPDGLTFHHDGGVTKLWFTALPEELRQQHGYDPIVAWKYQREVAESNKLAETEALSAATSVPATISVYGIETKALPNNEFWVRFSLQNLTDRAQSIRIVPCEENMAAIISGKVVDIPALGKMPLQQIVVPEIQPRYLKITSGPYQTNCMLKW